MTGEGFRDINGTDCHMTLLLAAGHFQQNSPDVFFTSYLFRFLVFGKYFSCWKTKCNLLTKTMCSIYKVAWSITICVIEMWLNFLCFSIMMLKAMHESAGSDGRLMFPLLVLRFFCSLNAASNLHIIDMVCEGLQAEIQKFSVSGEPDLLMFDHKRVVY